MSEGQHAKKQVTSALQFGVGSFTFETFPASEENDDGWEDKVRSLLESIPTVRDVEINGVESFAVPEGPWGDGDLWDPDGVLLTPHPSSGTLSFRITIPIRIQKEIAHRVLGQAFSEIESFYVLTFYRAFPVTYVFAEGEAGPHSMGAEAVRILRVFLAEETKRYRTNDSICFTFTGPSPFHYDFMLRESAGEEMKAAYMVEMLVREPQDELVITYDSAVYDSAYAAIPSVCRQLAPELARYYTSERMRIRRAKAMEYLRTQTDQLLAMTLRRGASANVSRFLQSRRLVSDLQLSLIAAEYRFQVEERDSQGMTERPGRVGLFQDEIQANIKAVFQEERINMNDIVELVSSRQKRDIDITMLLITSLLGGIIGTILTLVLTIRH